MHYDGVGSDFEAQWRFRVSHCSVLRNSELISLMYTVLYIRLFVHIISFPMQFHIVCTDHWPSFVFIQQMEAFQQWITWYVMLEQKIIERSLPAGLGFNSTYVTYSMVWLIWTWKVCWKQAHLGNSAECRSFMLLLFFSGRQCNTWKWAFLTDSDIFSGVL